MYFTDIVLNFVIKQDLVNRTLNIVTTLVMHETGLEEKNASILSVLRADCIRAFRFRVLYYSLSSVIGIETSALAI